VDIGWDVLGLFFFALELFSFALELFSFTVLVLFLGDGLDGRNHVW